MSDELIQLMHTHNSILNIIAEQLQELVQLQQQATNNGDGPNYRRQLSEYASFDWFSINANPTREVGDGINEVDWGGYAWRRRSGTGKFGNAIWFSRSTGKNEDNTPKYARLITFKDNDSPEPLQVHIEPGPQEHSQPPQNPPISPELNPITRDQIEYERHQLQAPPMTEAQAVGAAQTAAPPDPKVAETTFYSLVKTAIRSGQVSVAIINEYTAAVKEVGWPCVLDQLQQDIAATA